MKKPSGSGKRGMKAFNDFLKNSFRNLASSFSLTEKPAASRASGKRTTTSTAKSVS